MKKVYLLLLVCFTIVTASEAQNAVIRGKLKTSDGQPAVAVHIGLKGTAKGTYSGEHGEYEITNIPAGTYALLASFPGLQTLEIPLSVDEDETREVEDMILNEDSRQLKEIHITAASKKYRADSASQSLRVHTPLIELSQNIQVITNDVLKDQQVISMSDGVVRNVSGLNKLEHWGDMYAYVSGRGSRIEAFRNGFNMVNSSWGPLTEDMAFVDHIEFVKGPAGFMLSNGDPAGLYNVVTKKPSGQTRGEASFTFGSFDLYRGTFDLEGKLSRNGRLLYRLNVAAQNKKSHRQNEYNDRYVIAPVLSYQVDDKTKLTLEYNYQRANCSDVGSFYVFVPDNYGSLPVGFSSLPAGLEGTRMNDHTFYANLQHKFNKQWTLTAQATRSIYKQVGTSMWANTVNADAKIIRGVGVWDAFSAMTMGQLFLNGDFNSGAVQHRLLAGLDLGNKNYMADWGQYHALDTIGGEFDPHNPNLGAPSNGYPNFDRTTPLEERAIAAGGITGQTYYSIYVQDELGFFQNRLRLTLAGRYTNLVMNNYGSFDSASHFTPRIGLSVSITKNFSVYALFDEAFTPQSGRLAGGGKVKPITGTNMEIGLKKDWFDGKWSSTLSIYNITKNNELTPDPYSPPTSGLSIVLGSKQVQGLELDIRGTLLRGLSVVANYAFTDSKVSKVAEGVTVVKVGDNVPGYSRHTANTWLNYKFTNGCISGFGISLGASIMKDRTSFGDLYWSKPDAKRLADYSKMDGGLFWEKEKIRVAANVFNILNAYLYSGSYYSYNNAYYYQTEAPRNFRVSVNYRF